MKDTTKTKNDSLTRREAEILPFIAEGMSSRQIAEKLFTSINTISRHRANMLAKTHSKNCTELVKYAIRAGLI
jgi:DNA-binding CsgD family transcriptional regulator